MTNALGENIKNNRTRMQFSQNQLAELVFTTKSTISKWESGLQVPSLDSLRLLSDIFRVPMYVLLGEKPTSIRDKSWEWFGKGVFWIFIWSYFDIFIGVAMTIASLLSIAVGIALPIIKPLTVLVIDLTLKSGVDKYEVMKIIGYALASPLISVLFIGVGIALFKISKTYLKFSTKVFWKTEIKLLNKKFNFPKINKWVWIVFGICLIIGLTLLITAISLIASENSWGNRMW